MWLRKSKVPGSAPGGLVWESLDDVVEVDDVLGLELLAIRDAGFSEAPAPAGASSGSAPAETPDSDAAAEVVEAPAGPRRGRPRKAPAEVVSE